MRHTLLLLSFMYLLACRNSERADGGSLTNTSQTKKTVDDFHYRDLLEEYVDSIQPKEIRGLFGQWTITSIAKTGGSLQDEKTIQQQVGHKLYLDSTILKFDFINHDVRIVKPKYKILYLDEEKGDNLKGTSYFEGYRMCRKQVVMLGCSKRIYFEVIHFMEMAYCYDGRIYFLTKDE